MILNLPFLFLINDLDYLTFTNSNTKYNSKKFDRLRELNTSSSRFFNEKIVLYHKIKREKNIECIYIIACVTYEVVDLLMVGKLLSNP